MAHALRLAADGPASCEMDTERLGLGRLYERAGDLDRAEQAYALAAASEDEDVAAQALARLAVLLRRQARHEEAARAWAGILSLGGERADDDGLERRATEALAIHHEHRARDLDAAKAYADALGRRASGQAALDAARRITRLEKKLRGRPGLPGL
jgi:tetratricopeptide (TPR) repeat protein